MIIWDTHIRELHSGVQTTLSAIRQKYLPVTGENVVRGIIRICIKCVRTSPIPCEQLMVNLLESRVTPVRPFLNCGVDYYVPITLKFERGHNRKTIKSYEGN